MTRLNWALGTVLVLIFTACQPATQLFEGDTKSSDGLFSNAPQTQLTGVAVVKLNTTALLPHMGPGKKEVDHEQLAKINAEQEKLIAKLEALSKELSVIFRYKWLINGVAFVLPPHLNDRVEEIVDTVGGRLHFESVFARPQSLPSPMTMQPLEFGKETTLHFIGAHRVHQELGVTGKGIRVGIIDTGIDYTHSALGGEGTITAYTSIDPDLATPAFPNKKVVGGIDVVGSNYGSGTYIPEPDPNPIDQAGHGTHVAATVAGRGDDENLYAGVAPEAELYAIKVFGSAGGTGDAAVIAGLEYAVDPNGDLDLSDQLHIVNLSLGSDYGQPHTLYQEAIESLVNGGTFTVAAAGNSGHLDYIVGSPSTTDRAFSVGAGIDNLPHNIEFPTVAFETPNFGDVLAEAVEGPISQPIAEAGKVSGELYYVGLANEITEEQSKELEGKVALIDRGEISFFDKLTNVKEAGAIGAIVVNNNPDEAPIPMGGAPDAQVQIPAVMVSYQIGITLKSEMEAGAVEVRFQNDEKILRPELVDTLTDFSSIGPRSEDSLLKPEIIAPGREILSALMGSGNQGVRLSGTSMAAPHIAGVAALLHEIHTSMPVGPMKALMMSTAKTMKDAQGDIYPVFMQGAGRVQAYEAAIQNLELSRPAFSMGAQDVESKLTLTEKVTITNTGPQKIDLKLVDGTGENLNITTSDSLSFGAGEAREVSFEITAKGAKLNAYSEVGEGFIHLLDANEVERARIPVLAILNRISKIKAGTITQDKNSLEVEVINQGAFPGTAYLFNLLDTDNIKERTDSVNQTHKSVACDLESVGYRIIDHIDENGDATPVLQVAAKLYQPITIWKLCELSVQFDTNGDGTADLELGGINSSNLGNLGGNKYVSVLLDAPKAKAIRGNYEFAELFGVPVEENYAEAILGMGDLIHYDHSTFMALEMDLSLLKTNKEGGFTIKVATLHLVADTVEPDDYLADHETEWVQIPAQAEQMPFYAMPESLLLQAGESQSLDFKAGSGQGKAILFFPTNAKQPKEQSEVLRP